MLNILFNAKNFHQILYEFFPGISDILSYRRNCLVNRFIRSALLFATSAISCNIFREMDDTDKRTKCRLCIIHCPIKYAKTSAGRKYLLDGCSAVALIQFMRTCLIVEFSDERTTNDQFYEQIIYRMRVISRIVCNLRQSIGYHHYRSLWFTRSFDEKFYMIIIFWPSEIYPDTLSNVGKNPWYIYYINNWCEFIRVIKPVKFQNIFMTLHYIKLIYCYSVKNSFVCMKEIIREESFCNTSAWICNLIYYEIEYI